MREREQKRIWPGWETVGLLGRGSFGEVYEIRRQVLGETERAALKCITIPQNESEIRQLREDGYDEESITGTFKEQLKSIITEYSLMRKLNGSSYVVNCDDVRYIQHDDGIGWDIFIKMELLTPLPKAIVGNVTEETVVRIGADLCRALVLCRKHSIIHRDIKPANIFLSGNGDYKLGDFGVAKTMDRTSGGTKIGTYDYMAPEVFRAQPYDSTVDIYSLGLVLYWLLNERRGPFLPLPPEVQTLSGREAARERRFRGERLPPPAHGSTELQRIALKACAFEPRDRYQTPEEMLAELEGLRFIRHTPAFFIGDDKTADLGFDAEQNAPQTVYGPPPEQKSRVDWHNSGSEKELETWSTPWNEAFRPEENNAAPLYGPPWGDGENRGRDDVPAWLKILVIFLAVAGVVLATLAVRRILAARGTDPELQTAAEAAASEEQSGEREAQVEQTDERATIESGAESYGASSTAESGTAENAETLSAAVSLQSADGLSRVEFVTASASSEFYQSDIRTTFYASGAISGTGNPWVEGAPGHGIGEWLRLYFSQEESIRYLYLRLGFASSDKLYQGNNRPSRLRLSFSDGSSVDCDFLDLRTPMLVTLSEPVSTSYVQLTILDVYPGDVDDDTCILLAAAYR